VQRDGLFLDAPKAETSLKLSPSQLRDVLAATPTPEDLLKKGKPAILAWLEPQRDTIENRALFTNSPGEDPARGLSMPELIDLIKQNVPEAVKLTPAQIAAVATEWSHVQIPAHKLVGGAVADSEIAAAINNALGKPGTVRVERPSKGWMEITAGGIEIGRDDSKPVDATVTAGWDGSIGASLTVGNVKGSFQISPDRKWQVQLAIPGSASVPVVDQMSSVFGASRFAASRVAELIDTAGGKTGQVPINVLKQGLSPVKDAVDTLTSVTEKQSRVSVGITASGDLSGAAPSVSVQATVTIIF
jgi:hypothetical protein